MSSVNRLALPTGTLLQDFQIQETLGQGGFGITYRAINTALDQQVAIKEYMPGALAIRDGNTFAVHPNGTDSEDIFNWGLKRFLDEARILARLTHPNIVRVIYYMSLNETGYMVMDFLRGQTLGHWLYERGGTLPQRDILEILDPLTDALALVHDNGLAHRDIKPDNIFMHEGKTPVLIDFGAARNVFSGHSQTVATIVTAGYSPNEQYSGVTGQGPWTDIYALGGVVYRMVTGAAPPDAPSRISHEMEGAPDPCESLINIADTSLDADFLHAIDWALRLRPNERPQNVREWRDALGLGARNDTAPTIVVDKASEIFDWSASRTGAETKIADAQRSEPDTQALPPAKRGKNSLITGISTVLALLVAAITAALWFLTREEDRIGNDFAQGFPLGKIAQGPVEISDAIGGQDNSDVILFDLENDSEVRFHWQSKAPEADLKLYDGDGVRVPLLAEDRGGVTEILSGSYALEISSTESLSQPYILELNPVELEKRPRPGKSPQDALDLAGRGRMNGSDVLYDGRIWPRQREHFFKFTLDQPSRVSVALEISNATGSLSFTNANSISMAMRAIEDGKADPIIANLPAGEHFIAIGMRGRKPWAYRLKVQTEQAIGQSKIHNARIAPAEEGESYETARLLPEPTISPQDHHIRFSGGKAEHYLELRPKEPGILNIVTTNRTFTEIEVFRFEDGGRIARSAGEDGPIRVKTASERYIIKLSADDVSAKGKLTLHITPGSVTGLTKDNPVQFGSLGERIIGDSGKLTPKLPEKWFSFSLDEPMRLVLEMAGPDNGPLAKGMDLALHGQQPDPLQSLPVREPGEILMRTIALEAGNHLLRLSAPDGQGAGYTLKLFALATLAGNSGNGNGVDPRVQGNATIVLSSNMSAEEGVRLAKAKARADAVISVKSLTETVSIGNGDPDLTSELLRALDQGVPYDESWRARWLGKNRLTVSVQTRIRWLNVSKSFKASLGKSRFMTGERIPVGLNSGEPLNIGLFAWQADGSIGRIFPPNDEQSYVMEYGEKSDITKDMGVKVASAPLPGKSASEEAILVVACRERARFASLAPTLAEAARSSLTRAISIPVFLARLAGFCPASLQLRVLEYRVANPGD
ncbi:MAG: serine/threonine protein kinase [Hyphomicrobiales bacterium]|nr:serine/threonine protein kinase [Hyphomicrobiales bacterium]